MRKFIEIQSSGKISKDELRFLMNKYYIREFGVADVGRSLVEKTVKAEGEFTIFALTGTPPKFYALYIPETIIFCLYNLKGDFKKKFTNILIQ
jgi:hypothetical protein